VSELVQPSKQPQNDDFAKCATGIVIPLFTPARGSQPPIAESLQTSALLRLLGLRILHSMRTAVDSTVRRCKTAAVRVKRGAKHLTQVVEILLAALLWLTSPIARQPCRLQARYSCNVRREY
jgi:hypothetical protein